MDIGVYYDAHYEEYLEAVVNSTFYSESFEKSYSEFDEKLEEADLYGKTIMVSEKQFSKVHAIIDQLCKKLNMQYIKAFVFEDFYYSVEAKGIKHQHLEISAKTIIDFSDAELTFLIARELYSIKINGINQNIIIEEGLKALENINIPIAKEVMRDTFKLNSFKYLRSLEYSCDNFGYSAVKSMNAATQAILKLILNNKYLVEQVNLLEFLNQGNQIHSLTDDINIFTKMDEKTPYGPFRIKNLLAFAVSRRGMDIVNN